MWSIYQSSPGTQKGTFFLCCVIVWFSLKNETTFSSGPIWVNFKTPEHISTDNMCIFHLSKAHFPPPISEEDYWMLVLAMLTLWGSHWACWGYSYLSQSTGKPMKFQVHDQNTHAMIKIKYLWNITTNMTKGTVCRPGLICLMLGKIACKI